MKNLITLLILSVQVFFCSNVLLSQQIDFIQNKNSAGKASLTSNAYYVNYVLGVANFSPELRLPIQIAYDSSLKEEGILGIGWKIPQLESVVIPNENGAIWITPWGEKVSFCSRKNISKTALDFYNEKDREHAYFSPFNDWTANGRPDNGSWTIFGRKDMKGWKFVYQNAKLRKIEAPSGQHIDFVYSGEQIESVKQHGQDFIVVKYDRDKNPSEIIINGVSNKLTFKTGKFQILPATLAGKLQYPETKYLTKVGQIDLNPLEFSYDSKGYLNEIKRGDNIEKLKIEHETLEERKNYLKAVSAAIKARVNTKSIHRDRIDGRILSDNTYRYSYPSNKTGFITLTNKLGQFANYEFDSQSGISKFTDFSGKTTSIYYFMRYDVAYNGKVRQIVDDRKRVLASYRYDKDTGKIIRFRDKAKNDINYKYDKSGKLTLISKRGAGEGSNAPIRSYTYEKGNLYPTKINDLDESGEIVKTTTIDYDKSFRPIKIDNGRNVIKYTYNLYGYPTKITDSFAQDTNITYDKYNLQTAKEFNKRKTCTEYNKNGFPVKVYTQYDGETLSSVEIEYDKNGAPISYENQDVLAKQFERDEYGRVSREIFADGTDVKYSYNKIGQLENVIDQNGHKISFKCGRYGLDSRKTAIGQITQNYYDEHGKLIGVDSKFEASRSDRSFSYTYDNLDRLVNISYGATEKETLKYDTWGRVIEISKNGLSTKFKYDHFGRLVEKREGQSYTKYAYDNYGKRLSRITTTGKSILDEYNTYDKFGRLSKTVSNGKIVEYIYNKKNQLSEQIIDGNKVVFEYTKLGQLSSKTLYSKDGEEILSELKYFYDKSGKITSRLANGKLQGYKYDAKNQLLSVTDLETKEVLEAYEYDASGNILQKTIKGEITTYTYDAANQLVSSISPDGKETKYAYDAAGRMIKEGEKTYEYGWLDKVLRVAENGKTLANFEYHNNGQLAKAIRENKTETFVWDGLALIERSGTKYINEPHAGGGNPVLAIGENTEAIFTDLLGTSLGNVSDRGYSAISKTSFGANSTTPNSFFTGKPYVEDLGYTFLLRNYRADIGKWLNQDLLGYPDGWNNFVYCNNISSNAIDLYGAWTVVGSLIAKDEPGRIILDHWLEGSGSDMNISTWGTYMKSNSLLSNQIRTELSKDAKDRTTSGNINKNIDAEIENGYRTGYEYLHGTNGGLDIVGTVTATTSSYSDTMNKIELVYNINLTWNDVIDPNEAYIMDLVLAEKASWIYSPKDYNIKINWSSEIKFYRYLPKEGQEE